MDGWFNVVSTIRLYKRSCQAALLGPAQVAKDGRRKYNAHVVRWAFALNIRGVHGFLIFAIKNNTADI